MCLLQKLVKFSFLNATGYLPPTLYCGSRAAAGVMQPPTVQSTSWLAFSSKNDNFAIDDSMACNAIPA